MAAAASHLCVGQASTLLDCFIHHKGCKGEQISPLFHLYLYLFFKFRGAKPYQILYRYLSTQSTAVGLWLRRRSLPFQISSLLLSSFVLNIYTTEKSYYWQNQPNSLKVKGYQEANSNVKQLLH